MENIAKLQNSLSFMWVKKVTIDPGDDGSVYNTNVSC